MSAAEGVVSRNPQTEGPKEGAVDIQSPSPADKQKKKHERCAQCNARVGIASSFRCKCGEVFCSAHRYPDMHNCSFDHFAAAQNKISKANPVVSGSKVTAI